MLTTPNSEDFYVAWSKAPKRTTHVCCLGFIEFLDGVPIYSSNWERWVPIVKKGKHTGEHRIYEWNQDSRSWDLYTDTFNKDIFPKTRMIKPSLINSLNDKHGHWDRS